VIGGLYFNKFSKKTKKKKNTIDPKLKKGKYQEENQA